MRVAADVFDGDFLLDVGSLDGLGNLKHNQGMLFGIDEPESIG